MQAKLTVKMDKDAIIDSDIFLEFNQQPRRKRRGMLFS